MDGHDTPNGVMNVALNDLQTKPWTTLWAHRRWALCGLLIGLALAAALFFVLPKKWEARMIVGPSGHNAGADLSAFVPQASSPALQYLLQRVNAVTAADFSVYETLMTGPRVAKALQNDDAFVDRLHKLCDACDSDPAALSHWLSRHVRVRQVGATQLRRISLAMTDRAFASNLLRALHRLSDETIRIDQRIRTDQRITYLREQLSLVNNPDHRDALVGLLKEQERTRMMVGIDGDFAAEAIDPPSVSHDPVSPDPFLLFPALAFIGAGCGLLIGLSRSRSA